MSNKSDLEGKNISSDQKKQLNETNPSSSYASNITRIRGNPLSRAEKSLTALTTKFMTLLQESPNGILDLRSVLY